MAKTRSSTSTTATVSPGDKSISMKRKVKGMKSGLPESSSQNMTCPICETEIKESTNRSRGDDAVECEGVCSAWLHRQCAGLSKSAFSSVCKSKDPFYCAHCKVQQLELELQSVRSQLTTLASKLLSVNQSMPGPSGHQLRPQSDSGTASLPTNVEQDQVKF